MLVDRPPFDIGSALFVWSIGQGVFLAALLAFAARGNRAANAWLAGLLFVLSLELLDQLAARHWFVYLSPSGGIAFLTHPTTFLVGPLFYFYARSLLRRGTTFQAVWPHLVLPALVMLDGMPGVLQAIEAGFPHRPLALPEPPTLLGLGLYAHAIGAALHAAAYVAAATRLLVHYRRSVQAERSRTALVHTGWLGVVGVSLVAILLATLGNVLVSLLFQAHVANSELVLAVAFALVVHGIGFMTVREPSVFSVRPIDAGVSESEVVGNGTAKYARSGMSPDEILAYCERVQSFVQRKRAYLDEDLRLGDLAEATGLTPNQLSQVLNQGLGVSFFDFINRYRVEEVKRRLRDPENAHLTHLAIALDCGFSSKSSFHRVFRRHVGRTPSDWAKSEAPTEDALPKA